MRGSSRLPLLLGILGWHLACAPVAKDFDEPAKPKKVKILETEYDDRAAGQEGEAEVSRELGIYKNDALQAYVNSVGQRVARGAPRGFDYRFRIVDQWSPNAFALPGGVIFVSRGLLALANTEDELACVLGHEITHAAARHQAAAQQTEMRLGPFSLGFARAAYMAAYQRDEERAADEGGQRLAAAAGYDPRAMAEFLKRLGGDERLMLGAQRIPGFFDTHPGTTERIASTETRGREINWTRTPAIAQNPEGYLHEIEGLVLGENPAEGIFRGSRFIHPDLDFTLTFPEGWTMVNTASAVGATSPKHDARIALEMVSEGDDPKKAAEKFLNERAVKMHTQVEEAQSIFVGELPAYQVRGRVPTTEGDVAGQLTWIAYRGRIYRISVSARSIVAPMYFGRAQSTTRSFRPLTGDERVTVLVARLRIAHAKQGETIDALSRRTGNAWDIEKTAVANGLFGPVTFSEGQPVKVSLTEPYHPVDLPTSAEAAH
ncbi:MAG TPA: M48 family metalloprotease [Myxococcota bacterium]|nr:M48 family metalloprotease [Myxococcota bacterium]